MTTDHHTGRCADEQPFWPESTFGNVIDCTVFLFVLFSEFGVSPSTEWLLSGHRKFPHPIECP